MTNFISENAFQNAINFQASNKTSLQLHNGQELKNTVKFYLAALLNSSHNHVKAAGIEPLNSFAVKQT